MMGTQIIFYILAAIILVFSFLAVTSLKVMRATIYLLFVLIASGGLYFLINYNFMAGVQLIVYAGGIVALIVFAVMLTHKIGDKIEGPNRNNVIFGALTSIAGAFVTISVILKHRYLVRPDFVGQDTAELGKQLLSFGDGGYLLPFEVISILLLASMIAAVVVAKRKL